MLQNNSIENLEEVKIEDEEINGITFEEFKLKFENNKQESFDSLEIKLYLPYTLKTMYVEDLISLTQFDENNIAYIDHCQFGFFKQVYLIKYYTNLIMDIDNLIEQFDYLKSNGVIKYIENSVDKDELAEMFDLIDKSIQTELDLYNKLESVIAGGIERLLSKIPQFEDKQITKWIDKMAKAVKGFDPSKYEQLQDMMKFAKGETSK